MLIKTINQCTFLNKFYYSNVFWTKLKEINLFDKKMFIIIMFTYIQVELINNINSL